MADDGGFGVLVGTCEAKPGGTGNGEADCSAAGVSPRAGNTVAWKFDAWTQSQLACSAAGDFARAVTCSNTTTNTVVADSVCVAQFGYTPAACLTCSGSNDPGNVFCSGHGTAREENGSVRCTCDDAYEGSDCSANKPSTAPSPGAATNNPSTAPSPGAATSGGGGGGGIIGGNGANGADNNTTTNKDTGLVAPPLKPGGMSNTILGAIIGGSAAVLLAVVTAVALVLYRRRQHRTPPKGARKMPAKSVMEMVDTPMTKTPDAGLLPTGWTQHNDEVSGNTYYSNTAEGLTQWERPTTSQDRSTRLARLKGDP